MALGDDEKLLTLHQRFLEIQVHGSESAERTIQEVFLDPIVQTKLRAAAGIVLRNRGSNCVEYADLFQEAMLILCKRMSRGVCTYRDRGPKAFEGWIWTVCYHACCEAHRKHKSSAKAECISFGHEILEEIPDRTRMCGEVCEQSFWRILNDALASIEDEQERIVLTDWAAGLDGSETSRLRGIHQRTVYRLRQAGVRKLRRLLSAANVI